MLQKELLLSEIKENNGIITTKETLELGIHKDILKELILKHEIIKIANGLYRLSNKEIDEYVYFSHRIPKVFFHMKQQRIFKDYLQECHMSMS